MSNIDLLSGVTAVFGAIISIFLVMGAYYFKRMEAHFKALHKLNNHVTKLSIVVGMMRKRMKIDDVEINLELENPFESPDD